MRGVVLLFCWNLVAFLAAAAIAALLDVDSPVTAVRILVAFLVAPLPIVAAREVRRPWLVWTTMRVWAALLPALVLALSIFRSGTGRQTQDAVYRDPSVLARSLGFLLTIMLLASVVLGLAGRWIARVRASPRE